MITTKYQEFKQITLRLPEFIRQWARTLISLGRAKMTPIVLLEVLIA